VNPKYTNKIPYRVGQIRRGVIFAGDLSFDFRVNEVETLPDGTTCVHGRRLSNNERFSFRDGPPNLAATVGVPNGFLNALVAKLPPEDL